MKTLKIKTLMTTLAVVATVGVCQKIQAQEITLPVVSKPAILDEGTERELTTAQVTELLPWAKDSKNFLKDLLENVNTLSMTDKVDYLIDGIKTLVGESGPKKSELLMRYALNRGLVLNEILVREIEPNSVGLVDTQLRILKSSINMAITSYDKDMEAMSKKSKTSLAEFGLDYFEFLSELNKSIFDASAQFQIQKSTLEFLQWDLYRDLNNTAYAAQIVKINNALRTFQNKTPTDSQAIALIRQMKSLSRQLSLVKANGRKINGSNYKELETLMAKKTLAKTITEAETYVKKAMDFVDSIEDFYFVVSPGISNPTAEYVSVLNRVAYEYRHVLFRDPDFKVTDVARFNKFPATVDQLIVVIKDNVNKVKSAEDFLTLFDYTVKNPHSYYVQSLKRVVMENMTLFISLNPTPEQKNILQARVGSK